MICPNCGKETETTPCTHCGTAIPTEVSAPKLSRRKSIAMTFSATVLLIMGVIVLVFAALLSYEQANAEIPLSVSDTPAKENACELSDEEFMERYSANVKSGVESVSETGDAFIYRLDAFPGDGDAYALVTVIRRENGIESRLFALQLPEGWEDTSKKAGRNYITKLVKTIEPELTYWNTRKTVNVILENRGFDVRSKNAVYVSLGENLFGVYAGERQCSELLESVQYGEHDAVFAVPNDTGSDVLSEGLYLVGTDIPAGLYAITAANGVAYYARETDASGDSGTVIAGKNFMGTICIHVQDGEYLELVRCTASAMG